MSTNTTDNYNREGSISPNELGELCLNFVGHALERASSQDTSRSVRQFFAERAGEFLYLSRLAEDIALGSNTARLHDVKAQVKAALAKYELVAHAENALVLVGGNTPHIGNVGVFGKTGASINQLGRKANTETFTFKK